MTTLRRPSLRLGQTIEIPTIPEVSPELVLRQLQASAILGAKLIRELWEKRAIDQNVRHTGAYVNGLRGSGSIRMVGVNELGSEDRPIVEVVVDVVNTAPHASYVEEGHGAFHLPSAIDWGDTSGRVKRTKDGKPYLHIPFRHFAYVPMQQRVAGSPEKGPTRHALRHMMPQEVYREAAKLTRTLPQNAGHQFGDPVPGSGGKPQFLAADRYHWGGRLTRGARPTGILVSRTGELYYERKSRRNGNPEWQSSRFEGLFRSGGTGHSRYMTIRTVMPTSEGWNIPAMAGKHIAARVAETAQAEVAPFIEEQFHNLLLRVGGLESS